ncbi:response regulator transcription factor [Conyzicola nivalis]|uniref:DNA-binding response regulator n=1 Tax=Conyzicola nivalis TaxID=1477021 RepID=A0A916SAD7_9MICO|nr:DNA-binding response regulator [Conyzicola nivalis]
MTAVRVLIADDHGAIRVGLRLILEAAGGIEVVGEAGDGATAVRQAAALAPDVVLMDIRMPGVDGIAATRQIVAAGHGAVLVLTTFDIDDYLFGALRAGAGGFLLKTVEPAALVDAVRRLAAGESVLAPEVTRRILDQYVLLDRDRAQPSTASARLAVLTARERDILTLVAEGLSNRQIADRLTISVATAKTHVSRMLGKLGCDSRLQAAILAREEGLVG